MGIQDQTAARLPDRVVLGGAVCAAKIAVPCDDGVSLHGHLWTSGDPRAFVIVNGATGVLARYYHRYARYLAERGFAVITYDYRGIGLSRPKSLRRSGFRWSDWGTLDFAAVLATAEALAEGRPIYVAGHSIGGFLPGLAEGFHRCSGLLTIGAQYAYWRDYAWGSRVGMVLKWHVAMPLLTLLLGYFPGQRLGWLEDLPAGVAFEWAFRRARMEDNHPPRARADIVRRLAAFDGPLLAVAASDDPYGTPAAINRALSYYSKARRSLVTVTPRDLGCDRIGHFDLFHDRHRHSLWPETAAWLESGGWAWNLGILKSDGLGCDRTTTSSEEAAFATRP